MYAMSFNNITDNFTKTLDEYNKDEVVKRLGGIIFVGILIVVGLIGNAHVLYIYGYKFKASNYRLFILLLAWLDIFACAISMPFILTDLLLPLKFESNILCKVLRFVNYFVVGSSALVLVTIAIERYLKICNANRTQMSKKRVKLACGIAVVLSFCLSIPAGLLYGRYTQTIPGSNMKAYKCYIDDVFSDPKYMSYYNLLIIVVIIIANTIIVVLYIRIAQKVYEQKHLWETKFSTPLNKNKRINNYDNKSTKNVTEEFSFETTKSVETFMDKSNSKGSEDDESTEYNLDTKENLNISYEKSMKANKATLRVTFMLFVITAVYAVSFLPHLILKIWTGLDADFVPSLSYAGSVAYYTFQYMIFINNVANPIIYGFCDSRFWKKMRILYGQKK